MVDLELSDLFFNIRKPNYDAIEYTFDGNEVLAALRDDAINFVRDYPVLCSGVCAADLVDDFWNRI